MHGKYRISFAISVCDNQQNFTDNFSLVVVAQWVSQWSIDHRVVQVEGSSPGGNTYQIFYSEIVFISVFLGLMDFSDIVILFSRPNSCCQQNLKCFDMPLLSLVLLSRKSSNDC